MRVPQLQALQIEGDQTYVASGKAKIPLRNLQPIARVRNKKAWTYIRGIHVALELVVDKSDAGTFSLEEAHSMSQIERVLLSVPGWSKPIIDISGQAGAVLHAVHQALHGSRGLGAGDVTVAASTQTTYYRSLFIPFQFPGSVSPDDGNIPIDMLKKATLEIQWADGSAAALYPSTTSIHSTSSIARVVAELIERDEFYVPLRYSLQSFDLDAEDTIDHLAGRTLRGLIEVPEHTATGSADDLLTAAERTQYTFYGDGLRILDQAAADDLIERWNRIHANARDERLTAHASAGAPFIPVWLPDTRPYSATQCPFFNMAPTLKSEGTKTDPKLVSFSTRPVALSEVVSAARMAGIRLPANDSARGLVQIKTPAGNRRWRSDMKASPVPVLVKS